MYRDSWAEIYKVIWEISEGETFMTIYVGNLSEDTTQAGLKRVFDKYGKVNSVTVIADKVSGNGLGFAFVEMPGRNQAKEAVDSLNRKTIEGRVIMVSETAERTERRKPVQAV
jgi:cold-inducible RNA-binding protein